MAWEHEEGRCPLAAVDRRLGDLHHLWHQAEGAYFQPDDFRLAIQSAIQTARQVSFVLQKNKDLIPDFDNWYANQQSILSSIPLMKWMVDARNRIEKQGDLEGHSFISAEIVASHLDDGMRIQVPAKLSDAPLTLLKSIPMSMLGDHIRKDGILRIRRRWIENTLPDTELLEAVATAYGHLARLVRSAHEQMGLIDPRANGVEASQPAREGAPDGRPPCMIGHEEARTASIWLATGAPLEFETIKKIIGREELMSHGPKLKKRYGVDAANIYADSEDIHDQVRSVFNAARRMFEKDGHHITIAILFRGGKPAEFRELRPMEHGHKFLMMRDLALHGARIGADAVILIGESWRARADPAKPYLRPVDSPSRQEFLSATAVSKDGEPLMLSAQILRTGKKGKKVKLAKTIQETRGAHFAFAPFYQVWKKEIPAHWSDIATGADGSRQEGSAPVATSTPRA